MANQGKLDFEPVAAAGSERYEEVSQQPLKPTVFVGLGGTGIKVLARFRRRLYDRYGDADFWKIYQWLGIDTAQGEITDGGVEKQKGMPSPARTDSAPAWTRGR